MFLKFLNEDTRKNYLELAYSLATVDGHLSKEEENLILLYRQELDLPEHKYSICKLDIDEILNKLADEKEFIKRIIFMEIYGLVLADEKIHYKENEIVQLIIKKFNLSEEFVQKSKELIEKLYKIYKDMNNLLFEKIN